MTSSMQAAMVTDLPFGGNFLDHRFVIDGHPPIPLGNEPVVQTLSVMGDYFGVMQIPIVAGRGLTETDREELGSLATVSARVATVQCARCGLGQPDGVVA